MISTYGAVLIYLFIFHVKQLVVVNGLLCCAEGKDFSALCCAVIVPDGRKMIVLSAFVCRFVASGQG